MRRLALLLLFASHAFADGDILVTTAGAPSFELHVTKDNSMVKGEWPKSAEECAARAAASIGEWSCVTRVKYTTVGACEPTAPEIKLQTNAEGFLVQPGIVVGELDDGSWGPTQEEGYMLNPYPACWVMGLIPYTGKWIAEEGPPVMEPVCAPTDVGCTP